MEHAVDERQPCEVPQVGCPAVVENSSKSCKVEQVSYIGVEPTQEYSSEVCTNQKAFDENATVIELPIKSELWIEPVKIEPNTDSDALVEPIASGDNGTQKDNTSSEEYSSDDTYERIPLKKTQPKKDSSHGLKRSKAINKPGKPTDSISKEDTKKSFIWRSKEERNKQDQFLAEHIRLACPLCDKTVSTFHQIRVHFKKAHNRRDAHIVCCDMKFDRRHKIVDHANNTSHKRMFSCVLCIEKFLSKSALSTHLREGKGQYTCDGCPLSFKQKCAFDAHKKCHWKPHCSECNKSFCSNKSLKAHKKLVHSNEDRYRECDTCGRKFVAEESLQRHMEMHQLGIEHSSNELLLQCEICQRWLKGVRNHRLHMTGVHGPVKDEEKVHCEICQKEFSGKRALISHKRNVHEAAELECDICGKKFKKQISLKDHRAATHTGDVLYRCEFCEYPFRSHSNFYVHVKKQHPEKWAKKTLQPRKASGVFVET